MLFGSFSGPKDFLSSFGRDASELAPNLSLSVRVTGPAGGRVSTRLDGWTHRQGHEDADVSAGTKKGEGVKGGRCRGGGAEATRTEDGFAL